MRFDQDLFNLEADNSVVRIPFNQDVDLSKLNLPFYEVPERFNMVSFFPTNGLDLAKLAKSAEIWLKGFRSNREVIQKALVPGFIETVKNAYEHGNKEDNTKEIFLARSSQGDCIEFLVGDQGGIINKKFAPYILLIRQGKHKMFYQDVPNFYEFSGDFFAPKGHSGVGTKTIHLSFDEVKYYRRSPRGVFVHLLKRL